MKTLLTTLLITLTISTTAQARTLSEKFIKAMDDCEVVEATSKAMMGHRQNNPEITLPKILKVVDDFDYGLKTVFTFYVIEAFKEPVYSTKEYKQKAINEFVNKHYLNCLEVKSK